MNGIRRGMDDYNAELERRKAEDRQRQLEAEVRDMKRQRVLRDFVEVMHQEGVRSLPIYSTRFGNIKRETGVFRKEYVEERVFYYQYLGDGWLLHENYTIRGAQGDDISQAGQVLVDLEVPQLVEDKQVRKITTPAEIHNPGIKHALPVILLSGDGTVQAFSTEHLSRDAIRLIENGQ